MRRPLQPRPGTARAAVANVWRLRRNGHGCDTGPAVGGIAGGRGKRMSNEHTGADRGTFSTAHAYIQISHTDGSFSEIGVNLKPAAGLDDDVEDALAECLTAPEILA